MRRFVTCGIVRSAAAASRTVALNPGESAVSVFDSTRMFSEAGVLKPASARIAWARAVSPVPCSESVSLTVPTARPMPTASDDEGEPEDGRRLPVRGAPAARARGEVLLGLHRTSPSDPQNPQALPVCLCRPACAHWGCPLFDPESYGSYAAAVWRRPPPAGRRTGSCGISTWKVEPERAVRLHPDPAVDPAHELAADVEAEPGAADAAASCPGSRR